MQHESLGDTVCCGYLNGVIAGDQARIVCNLCHAVIRSIPAADLQKTLTEVELSLDFAFAICPFCRSVNIFPGFLEMFAFNCTQCGKPALL